MKLKENPPLKSLYRQTKTFPKRELNNTYRQLSQRIVLTICLSLAGVVSFNFVMNPYGVFNLVSHPKINQNKPKKLNNDRLFKATDIIALKPTAVLLGSSRIRQGMNPNHPILQQYLSTYNLGLNGGNIYEIRQYLEHSLVNNPELETVVLGIDFFMFNGARELQPAFDENRLKKKYIIPNDLLNTLFSLTAFGDSQVTLLANLKSPQNQPEKDYGKNGFFPYLDPEPKHTQGRFQDAIKQYLDFHHQYTLSPVYINEFRQVVKICQDNNIELKIFISPSHAIQWETIAATGEWNTFERWKKEIVKIAPVWDFSGYNSITSEPLQAGMKNYTDSSHYTSLVGDLVLNRLFDYKLSSVPSDFGVLVSENNIEEHLQMIREKRKKWQNSHPQTLAFVKKIKADWDAQQ